VRALIVPDATVMAIDGEAPGIDHFTGIIIHVRLEAQGGADLLDRDVIELAGLVATGLAVGYYLHLRQGIRRRGITPDEPY